MKADREFESPLHQQRVSANRRSRSMAVLYCLGSVPVLHRGFLDLAERAAQPRVIENHVELAELGNRAIDRIPDVARLVAARSSPRTLRVARAQYRGRAQSRAKRWQGGMMVLRWTAAGVPEAEHHSQNRRLPRTG
jgi:hypothetical protein